MYCLNELLGAAIRLLGHLRQFRRPSMNDYARRRVVLKMSEDESALRGCVWASPKTLMTSRGPACAAIRLGADARSAQWTP